MQACLQLKTQRYANPMMDRDLEAEFYLSETFLAISPSIMVRLSKFKISLEAVKALYLLILMGQRYANEFCVLARGVPVMYTVFLMNNYLRLIIRPGSYQVNFALPREGKFSEVTFLCQN